MSLFEKKIIKNNFRSVFLNARGVKYEVLVKNLEKHPNTRLGKLLNASDSDSQIRFCDDVRGSQEFYFDRDPYLLNSILDFYSSGKFHLKNEYCVNRVKEELAYWELEEHCIDLCCRLNYFEKVSDVESAIIFQQKIISKLDEKEDFGKCCLPQFRQKVWEFLDKPKSSIYARNYTQNVIREKSSFGKALDIIEAVCLAWFTFEFLIRFLFCPNKLRFLVSPLNIIDLVSIIPFYLFLILVSSKVDSNFVQLLRALRIILLLKITRYSKSLRSFGSTIKKSIREIVVLFVYLSVGVILFASFVYYSEKDVHNSNFTSIPASFWWAVITMTTVGYGDMVPMTIVGKIFGSFCAICGLLLLGLPVGIIASNFINEYHEKGFKKEIIKIENKQRLTEKF